jgi:hypothetical protein
VFLGSRLPHENGNLLTSLYLETPALRVNKCYISYDNIFLMIICLLAHRKTQIKKDMKDKYERKRASI